MPLPLALRAGSLAVSGGYCAQVVGGFPALQRYGVCPLHRLCGSALLERVEAFGPAPETCRDADLTPGYSLHNTHMTGHDSVAYGVGSRI